VDDVLGATVVVVIVVDTSPGGASVQETRRETARTVVRRVQDAIRTYMTVSLSDCQDARAGKRQHSPTDERARQMLFASAVPLRPGKTDRYRDLAAELAHRYALTPNVTIHTADILAFDTDLVPVGLDQVQHVEMTIDLARAANRRWGPATLKLPQPLVSEGSALVPGTDGRKMSKSYGNVLPVFADARTLTALVRKVPTDSLPVEAPKDPTTNPLATWYRCADPEAAEGFERRLRTGGLGWGEAKAEVADALVALLEPVTATYGEVRGDEARLQRVLTQGGLQARGLAQGVLSRVKSRIF